MRTILAACAVLFTACAPPSAPAPSALQPYVWERVTEHAPYGESYNWPVHVARDGRFIALHPEGTWASTDGARWTRTPLPFSGTNSAYLGVVQHDGATWTLGAHTGNYERFTVDPLIRRTRDYVAWEDVGRSATLPHTIFYGVASFKGAMWIVGGYRDGRESGEVWRSTNGVDWTRLLERAPWSARSNPKLVTFHDRLFLIGGGILDGAGANDVWSTADGVDWRRETTEIAPENPIGYAAIVFDERLWLVGANRSGAFSSEMLVSEDGKVWRAANAPWSPRGGVGAWAAGDALYITGGKYSVERNGAMVFLYSNDVWRMRARR